MMTMTPELALKLTRKCGPDEELTAAIMRKPRGIVPVDIYSLDEFVHFIQGDNQTLPSVNFTLLSQWIGETLGDTFLADQISAINAQDVCYIDKCKLTYPVVRARLKEAVIALYPDDDLAIDPEPIEIV